MKRTALIISALTAFVALSPLALAEPGDITMAHARAIALKAAPGKIEKEEREREGGSERYSFDIRQGNKIHEIGVDVKTGRIVEDKFEPLDARD